MCYKTLDGDVYAVDHVSLSLERGKTLGIVGESGCGKTSLVNALLNLLPENGRFAGGSIIFGNVDLLSLNESELKKYRWNRIAVVFQNAMSALDPVYRVGHLLKEILLIHRDYERHETERRLEQVFELVRLPRETLKSYPHQLSGGMKQRVSIAASLLCEPDIVILDEPTTALDILLQDSILQEIEELREKLQLTIIIVSHDISVISEICDTVAVMYAGRLVEIGESSVIFSNPSNPYTILLIGSFPKIDGEKKDLIGISGSPPGLIRPPSGCRFHPRCPYAKDICEEEEPPWLEISHDHYSLCHFREVV
jgi:peptide/nickel transport system ATP-binding protein